MYLDGLMIDCKYQAERQIKKRLEEQCNDRFGL